MTEPTPGACPRCTDPDEPSPLRVDCTCPGPCRSFVCGKRPEVAERERALAERLMRLTPAPAQPAEDEDYTALVERARDAYRAGRNKSLADTPTLLAQRPKTAHGLSEANGIRAVLDLLRAEGRLCEPGANQALTGAVYGLSDANEENALLRAEVERLTAERDAARKDGAVAALRAAASSALRPDTPASAAGWLLGRAGEIERGEAAP